VAEAEAVERRVAVRKIVNKGCIVADSRIGIREYPEIKSVLDGW